MISYSFSIAILYILPSYIHKWIYKGCIRPLIVINNHMFQIHLLYHYSSLLINKSDYDNVSYHYASSHYMFNYMKLKTVSLFDCLFIHPSVCVPFDICQFSHQLPHTLEEFQNQYANHRLDEVYTAKIFLIAIYTLPSIIP